MTREQQIEEQALIYSDCSEKWFNEKGYFGDSNPYYEAHSFADGAKWADANPQFSKQWFIEKACEWLISSFAHLHNEYGCKLEFGNQDVFIEAFKKAMEE